MVYGADLWYMKNKSHLNQPNQPVIEYLPKVFDFCSKYILSICQVLGTILGTGDVALNRVDKM